MGKRTLIFDVETTGLAAYDRVVSIGGIWCDGFEPTGEDFYLVFNPKKASHPAAAAAHGLADWWLRYQPLFDHHAGKLQEAFARADLMVGHNVAFDLRMMNHEFAHHGYEITAPALCTMQMFQAHVPDVRANLDSCLAHIGLKRSTGVHSAHEDSFLTMNLYRWLNGQRPCPAPARLTQPSNGVPPPPEVAWAVTVDSAESGRSCPPPPEAVIAMLAQWGIDITGHSPRIARAMLAAHDYALMLARRIPGAESQAQMRALICALADADSFHEPLLEWSRWAWGRSNPQLPRNALRRFAEDLLSSLVD